MDWQRQKSRFAGAALFGNATQGTVEHLLVMPVVPSEIMLSKILANGIVIVVAAGLSLLFVVQWWLQVPIRGIASSVSGRLVLLRVHGRSAWHCSWHYRFHDGPVWSALQSRYCW